MHLPALTRMLERLNTAILCGFSVSLGNMGAIISRKLCDMYEMKPERWSCTAAA